MPLNSHLNFWMGVFPNYIALLKHNHPPNLKRKIAIKALMEVEAYENRNLHQSYFDKFIAKLSLELKGVSLIVLGQIENAYKHLRQAEIDDLECMESSESDRSYLNERLLFCERKLGLLKNTKERFIRLKERNRNSRLNPEEAPEPYTAFQREVEIAELSSIFGDIDELKEAVMTIERRLLDERKLQSKLALVSNLIQTCLENSHYDIALRLSQQRLLVNPEPEAEFLVGLCFY